MGLARPDRAAPRVRRGRLPRGSRLGGQWGEPPWQAVPSSSQHSQQAQTEQQRREQLRGRARRGGKLGERKGEQRRSVAGSGRERSCADPIRAAGRAELRRAIASAIGFRFEPQRSHFRVWLLPPSLSFFRTLCLPRLCSSAGASAVRPRASLLVPAAAYPLPSLCVPRRSGRLAELPA